MKIFGTKANVFIDFVSENYIWSSQTTNLYRTIFGIELWLISSKRIALKYGEPYIAKL